VAAEPFSGAVLVGGASSRMGRDKAELFADGVEDALRRAGASEVLRVGRAAMPDDVEGAGPLGGIATALQRATDDVVVVLACDLVAVTPDGIRMVVAALTDDADVALPPGQPLHAAWRRRALPTVLAALEAGRFAVRAAIDGLRAVEVGGLDPRWLANVNSPEDLVQTECVADTAVPEVDIDELTQRRAAGAHLVDVRTPKEYVAGHVPGAVLLPLSELGDRWEEVPEGDVLVICQTGARSARAVEALNGAGRTTVNVAGGTKAWMEAGRPVVTGPNPE
jgi:molybdopterin-guanine dinucleotide biosynthesis protein A/rhodanese-related sulfurtransferase